MCHIRNHPLFSGRNNMNSVIKCDSGTALECGKWNCCRCYRCECFSLPVSWSECVRVVRERVSTCVYSLRVSTVMISSLHRRWHVWLSASRPELKSRHSIHSLKPRRETCFQKFFHHLYLWARGTQSTNLQKISSTPYMCYSNAVCYFDSAYLSCQKRPTVLLWNAASFFAAE